MGSFRFDDGDRPALVRRLRRALLVVAGALAVTLAHFLVLPLMQTIGRPPEADLILQPVDTADLPPPPPPEEEREEEPEQDATPQLTEAAPPLDLSQLELVLDPGQGGAGWLGGDLGAALASIAAKAGGVDDLFTLADLDQKPRVVYQPSPVVDATLRKKAPATVHVLFVVDQTGKVESPSVQTATDADFERPALAAVKQWRFDPGKRKGTPVRFRMRVPITFPKS